MEGEIAMRFGMPICARILPQISIAEKDALAVTGVSIE